MQLGGESVVASQSDSRVSAYHVYAIVWQRKRLTSHLKVVNSLDPHCYQAWVGHRANARNGIADGRDLPLIHGQDNNVLNSDTIQKQVLCQASRKCSLLQVDTRQRVIGAAAPALWELMVDEG